MMSPVTGMMVPWGPWEAVSCRASRRRPMTKTLAAPLTARARTMVRPRPAQSVLLFILMLMGVSLPLPAPVTTATWSLTENKLAASRCDMIGPV